MVEDAGLEARMDRAMQEAEDEEEGAKDRSTDDDKEFMGSGAGSSGVYESDAGDEMDEGRGEGDDDESYSKDESMDTAS